MIIKKHNLVKFVLSTMLFLPPFFGSENLLASDQGNRGQEIAGHGHHGGGHHGGHHRGHHGGHGGWGGVQFRFSPRTYDPGYSNYPQYDPPNYVQPRYIPSQYDEEKRQNDQLKLQNEDLKRENEDLQREIDRMRKNYEPKEIDGGRRPIQG